MKSVMNLYLLADSLPTNWDQGDILGLGAKSKTVCDVSTQYSTGHASENPRQVSQ